METGRRNAGPLACRSPASAGPWNYLRCFATSLVISNIETCFLPPNTSFSLLSALIMKPDGVIAFHVSNRFLDLKPVLLAIAERHKLEYAYIHETGEGGATTSDWVLLTRNRRFLLKPSLVEATEPVVPRPDWRLWTDDYNNLVQVFRR